MQFLKHSLITNEKQLKKHWKSYNFECKYYGTKLKLLFINEASIISFYPVPLSAWLFHISESWNENLQYQGHCSSFVKRQAHSTHYLTSILLAGSIISRCIYIYIT